eukprot:38911-Chlamydomonas_euryale.AAC.5
MQEAATAHMQKALDKVTSDREKSEEERSALSGGWTDDEDVQLEAKRVQNMCDKLCKQQINGYEEDSKPQIGSLLGSDANSGVLLCGLRKEYSTSSPAVWLGYLAKLWQAVAKAKACFFPSQQDGPLTDLPSEMPTTSAAAVRTSVKGEKTTQQAAVVGTWLSIPEDQCFCLLGPNGAGKTTTIKCLTGVSECARVKLSDSPALMTTGQRS